MDSPGSAFQQGPLLKTKLYLPPARPTWVSRPRLIERLNEGIKRKLTLISAPAGFGKTTLLSEWVNQGNRRAVWVSLDESDNDAARFLAYIVAALQTIEPELGQTALNMLQAGPVPRIQPVLTILLNEMAGIPDHLALILDDYHMITAEPVHAALTFLLDHLPPQLHVVIATRADPPLPISRLRAHGELIELRQTDLCFTDEEAATFLNQTMQLKLLPGDVAVLAARTEGWIAGLQMAAISMRDRRDIANFIAAFAGGQHHVLDYLAEEVLQRQPEHVQSFLLKTSILNRMSGPLCDAVIGSPPMLVGASQAMLEHLEHANLFVVPLDDQLHWYRYHHLFADLLRDRLQLSQPELVSVLHRRASEWYAQKGFFDEAIDHALSAGDFDRAADLISKQAESLWARGETITLSRWLAALPDELVSSWPELTLHHAIVLFMAGRLEEVEQHLHMAERVLGTSSDPSSRGHDEKLQGMIAMVRAYIALFRGDPCGMAQFSRQALEYLPDDNSMWRSGAATILGDAYSWSGDIASAIRHYNQAMAINRAIGNVYYALMVASKIATNEMQWGQLHRAAQICQESLHLAHKSGLTETARAGVLMAILGQVFCEWNDLDGALEYIQKGTALCEQEENVVMLGFNYVGLANVYISGNDLAGIEETFQKLEKLAQKSRIPPWIIAAANGWQAYALLRQNKLNRIAKRLQTKPSSLSHSGVCLARKSRDWSTRWLHRRLYSNCRVPCAGACAA